MDTALHRLRERFQGPGLEIERLGGDGPLALQVRAERGQGTVLLRGAQLWSWRPAGHHDLLWQSPVAGPSTAACPYGGIPICWPYMGAGPQAGDPFHGPARTHDWQLLTAQDDGDGGWIIRLGTDHRAAGWRQSFSMTLTLRLGAAIDAGLEIVNSGDTELVSAGALHSYLAVGDRQHLRLHGLRGRDYSPQPDAETKRDDGDPLPEDDEWVRNYRFDNDHSHVLIDDPGYGRRLHLGLRGARALVLWNPGPQRATAIAGIGPHGWPGFLCLEAANIMHDRRHLAPGQSHVLATTIAVDEEPVTNRLTHRLAWPFGP